MHYVHEVAYSSSGVGKFDLDKTGIKKQHDIYVAPDALPWTTGVTCICVQYKLLLMFEVSNYLLI